MQSISSLQTHPCLCHIHPNINMNRTLGHTRKGEIFSVTNSHVLVSISSLSKQISQRNSATSKSRACRNSLFIPLCWRRGCLIENCHVKALTVHIFPRRPAQNLSFEIIYTSLQHNPKEGHKESTKSSFYFQETPVYSKYLRTFRPRMKPSVFSQST